MEAHRLTPLRDPNFSQAYLEYDTQAVALLYGGLPTVPLLGHDYRPRGQISRAAVFKTDYDLWRCLQDPLPSDRLILRNLG